MKDLSSYSEEEKSALCRDKKKEKRSLFFAKWVFSPKNFSFRRKNFEGQNTRRKEQK